MKPVIKLVGWTPQHDESNSRSMLRSLVLAQAGEFGDKAIQAKAAQIFKTRQKKAIHPNMRAMVYSLTGAKGNQKTFADLKKMYETTSLQEEQRRVTRGLFAFENSKVFEKSLNLPLSKTIRSQDATILMYWSFQNIHNRKLAWTWLKKNWSEIHKRYHNDHLIVYAIEGLSVFANKKMAKEVGDFFKKNPVPSANRKLKQVIEQINLKAAWIDRDRRDIANCLKRLNSL